PAVMSAGNIGHVRVLPGDALGAYRIKRLFKPSTPTPLLLTAQLAWWSFWTHLVLFFPSRQVPVRLRVLGVLLVGSRPSALLLVASYSEALFLTGLLGFLYWSGSPSRGSFWSAALHGFVMTGTRLVGVPVVIIPLCRAFFNSGTVDSGKQVG